MGEISEGTDGKMELDAEVTILSIARRGPRQAPGPAISIAGRGSAALPDGHAVDGLCLCEGERRKREPRGLLRPQYQWLVFRQRPLRATAFVCGLVGREFFSSRASCVLAPLPSIASRPPSFSLTHHSGCRLRLAYPCRP